MSQARKWKQTIIIILISLMCSCALANGTTSTTHTKKIHASANKKHHAATARKSAVKHHPVRKKVIAAGKPEPWFNSIETDGDFEIQIHTSRTNRIQIQRTDCYIDSWVEGGVLHLVLLPPPDAKPDSNTNLETPPMPLEPIHVTVWMPELQNLTLNGTNSVMGDPIYSEWLNIDGEGQSNIILRGLLNVNKIIIHGASDVSLRWIKSHHLVVRGYDSSEIFLAGTADVLDAKLTDDAHLDARYLRSHTVLVETESGARANVLALKSLNAFAYGSSNIYYYKSPNYQLAETEFMGNVLQLGHWK